MVSLLCLGFSSIKKPKFTYMALGDGYTLGCGVEKDKTWPYIISNSYKELDDIKYEFAGVFADSAATVKELIKNYITTLQTKQPDLLSINIGMQDVINDASEHTFREDYTKLVLLTLQQVPSHNSVLLITIPDFTTLPMGKTLTHGFDARQKIIQFNNIIKEIAQQNNIHIFDIFQQSDQLGKVSNLLSANGIYPSAFGHERWAKMIKPELDYLRNIPLKGYKTKRERKKEEQQQ